MNACKQCGTCCLKGGPTLHSDDRPLIRSGVLALGDLVTIRRHEPVLSPLTNALEHARQEFVRVRGSAGSWRCPFLTEALTCGIYSQRPLECRALACWDTAAIEALIYRDVLTRLDLIPTDAPLREEMIRHETACPHERFAALAIEYGKNGNQRVPPALRAMIEQDLEIRHAAVCRHGLTRDEELFAFGRPFFLTLDAYGLELENTGGPAFRIRFRAGSRFTSG